MIIALAGHVDHGKTALIRALTGIDADRLPEEKRRGMTIDLGFAHMRLPSGVTAGFVDVPGHERFLTNMLAGVLSVDTVLLVVAADDGPMPQTREHLEILALMSVTRVSAVLSKIDRVAPARRAAARAEVRDALDGAGFLDAPILDVSSLTGEGIEAVRAHIEMIVAARRDHGAAGRFRLAIDRSFTPAGAGLVVTGTVASGAVRPGDRLLLSPGRLAARVRGIEVHHSAAGEASAGDRCALALSGPRVERRRLHRGDWLVDPFLHAPTARVDVQVRAARAHAPRHAARVRVHHGTGTQMARVLIHGAADLEPGTEATMTLALDGEVACLWGDRVILRDESTGLVIGGGRVIDPFAPVRRARRDTRAAAVAARAVPDPAGSFQALLEADGWADLEQFRRARNLPDAFSPVVPADGLRIGTGPSAVYVSSAVVLRAIEDAAAFLRRWHADRPDETGPGKAALRGSLAALPDRVADAALDLARERGVVVRDGLAWRLPEHRPVLAPADEEAWTRIETLLSASDLRPPRVREIVEAMGGELAVVEALLARLERFGRLARVAPNRYFLPETISALAALARTLEEAADDGGFTAADFNRRSGIGRNLTIEVLEFLDTSGITRRYGDLRHVVSEKFG